MSFKSFPGSGWQENDERYFKSKEGKCVVCQTSYDLGKHAADSQIVVCQTHSNCQLRILQRIVRLRAENELLSKAEWEETRHNSWDRDALVPFMSDEVLVELLVHAESNCYRLRVPCSTYDEAIRLYTRELLARYQRTDIERKQLKNMIVSMENLIEESRNNEITIARRSGGQIHVTNSDGEVASGETVEKVFQTLKGRG